MNCKSRHFYRNRTLTKRNKEAQNYLCDGGIGTFSILASGAVYPCTIAVNNKRFCMGTVFGEINNGIVDEIQEMGSKSISKCEGCGRYDYCISTRCRIVNKVFIRRLLRAFTY